MHAEKNSRLSSNRDRFAVEQIERMVHEFYGRVRSEPVLGPIFDRRIDDWPHHLDRMVGFWRAVLRSEPTFTMSERGSPPILHRQIDGIEVAHFERWLALFGEVVDDTFAASDAADVKAAAQRIGVALSRHLAPGSPRPQRGL